MAGGKAWGKGVVPTCSSTTSGTITPPGAVGWGVGVGLGRGKGAGKWQAGKEAGGRGQWVGW